jgi:hypothetical protein
MADKKEAKSKRHLKEAIDVTPSQLIALLRIALKEKMRIMVCGEPGIGKSDIMAQVCDEAGVDMILNHPVVDDPTAVSGMPDLRANAEYATFKPFGNLYRALTATKPTILVLDDFGNAAPMVQASWMQYILAGRLNEHVLPDCVTIWAATNERTHMTGVTGMLEAVKDRFDAIVRLVANLEDSKMYFYKKGFPSELAAFLEMRPDLLSDFDPKGDMSKSPSPRSWAKCAKWIDKILKGELPADLHLPALSGCVGEGAGGELKAALDHMVNMPNLDKILEDPENGDVPTEPAIMYAVCTGLAYRNTVDVFPQIIKYASKLHKAKKTEFSALLLRDAIARDPSVVSTPHFEVLSKTEVGQRIIGRKAA